MIGFLITCLGIGILFAALLFILLLMPFLIWVLIIIGIIILLDKTIRKLHENRPT